MVRCLNCMGEYESDLQSCPVCGYRNGENPKESYHLWPGMELIGRYVIGTVIGFGGFGVIYKAWDRQMDKVVAVKEYFPMIYVSRTEKHMQVNVYDSKNIAAYEKGKKEFLEEARSIAKFNSHPNIVHVYDYFEACGTAYFIMGYLEGHSLTEYLAAYKSRGEVVDTDTALYIIQSVLNALKAIHKFGILHRDIKPGNIFICDDGSVKLIDFGASRFANEDTEMTRTIIITPGYAPVEQYQTKSRQGPYTDIYATAAVLYEMLTGIRPEESLNRKIEDTLIEPSELNSNIAPWLNSTIMRAMAVRQEIRFHNVEQFEKALSYHKNIRNDREEIVYRNKRRTIYIILLSFIVLFSGIFCYGQYRSVKREAVLEPAAVSVWIPCMEGCSIEDTEQLFQNMTAEFQQNNSEIEIELTVIEIDDYAEKLNKALRKGTAPILFDSTCLNKEDYEELADLKNLLAFSLFRPGDYYLLDDYEEYFPSRKQIPLTCDVPVIYENVKEMSENSGEDIDWDQLVELNYEMFIKQRTKVYLGMVHDYYQVQEDLPGMYEVRFPYEAREKGCFFNLWSVYEKASEKEYHAAIRIIYYLLSETSQDYLTVQNKNHLPLNKNVLQAFEDVNGDFAGISDYIDSLDFKGEAQNIKLPR